MKTPPLLLGAALLFWGWQSGQLPLAAALAAALELSCIIDFRWELAYADFRRIATFCNVLFIGTAVFLASSKGMPHAVIALFVWLPVVLLPLTLAQMYSKADVIDLSALFLFLYKNKQDHPGYKVDLTYPYFALCLLSASAANTSEDSFYFGLIALGSCALWFARPKQFSLFIWAVLLSGTAVLGYAGQIGLHRLQGVVENVAQEWLTGGEADTDPYRATTAIGRIGEIKLADKIVLRVNAEKYSAPPFLLHEASYDTYFDSLWMAKDAGFTRFSPAAAGNSWVLNPGEAGHNMTVSRYLQRGKGMLALPSGVIQVDDLPALEMKKNRLGAVEMVQEADMVIYRVQYSPSTSAEGAPTAYDLKTPPRELQAISDLATNLRLAEHAPQEIPGIVKKYFEDHYTYSTYQRKHDGSVSPLAEFLLETRTGHCEYFATATTLLLRAAGIPARYAVGYSVQEYSELEKQYIARSRHAHAWARVYLNGVWQDLDTTPSSWLAVEEKHAPVWETIADLWYWGVLQFYKWRESRAGMPAGAIAWLGLPLLLFLVWYLYLKKRPRKAGNKNQLQTTGSRQGNDSEFYLIEQHLAGFGYGRNQDESFEQWLCRLDSFVIGKAERDALYCILALHYRYRFDPVGINAEERNALKEKSRAWLAMRTTAASYTSTG